LGVRSIGWTALACALFLAPQPPLTIRSRTTLVPVDVRVVDARGNPVTDLTQEDFSIIEDRVPQTIRLFEAQTLRPEPPVPGVLPPRRELTEDSGRAIQNRRVFLFVFGRGRLQEPEKGIDAAMAFVRERLLPQDRAAVAAFNRATDFTTDRVAILRTLEEFRKRHKRIDAELTSYFGGLRGAYASQEPPPDIQAQIDAVFYADRLARVLPGVEVPRRRGQVSVPPLRVPGHTQPSAVELAPRSARTQT
jgi:VWFA-related protein